MYNRGGHLYAAMRYRNSKKKLLNTDDKESKVVEEVHVDEFSDCPERKGILNRLKYQRDNVTMEEWNSLYQFRMNEIKTLDDEKMANFLEKWALYTKNSEYVI